MKSKTKSYALVGIYAALTFLLAMTPIGLIPLGFINLTIVHIPVIIGTLVSGRKTGVALGLAFGLASTLAAFGASLATQSSLAALLLTYSPFCVIVMCIIPRLMIPVATTMAYKFFKKTRPQYKETYAVVFSAVAGSLANTVLYLFFMGLFFAVNGIWGNFTAVFSFTLFIGAIAEAAFAAFICVPVVRTIRNYKRAKQEENDSYYSEPRTNAERDTRSATVATSMYDEEIEPMDVAVMPPTESLLPLMNEDQKRAHDKCMMCLNSGSAVFADTLFSAFAKKFSSKDAACGVNTYAAMRFIEAREYGIASNRIVQILAGGYLPNPESGDGKRVVLGMLRIIRTAVVDNSLMSREEKQRLEQVFIKTCAYIEAENYILAGQVFSMFVASLPIA